MKIYPKIEMEDIGDEDSRVWVCRASRNGFTGVGQSNDSLKAREKAIESLEKKEKEIN